MSENLALGKPSHLVMVKKYTVLSSNFVTKSFKQTMIQGVSSDVFDCIIAIGNTFFSISGNDFAIRKRRYDYNEQLL